MLKIKAQDSDDIAVMSAFLQDTAIQRGDLMWEATAQRFGFVGQRYCWENEKPVRVNTRFWVDHVGSVQRKSTSELTALDLLAITSEPEHLLLHFADGETVRLNLSTAWRAYLEDFGPTWPAKTCPDHS